jgi:hypothetical protein
MNSEEIEGLLRDFMQAIQIVLESGEILSDEFQGMLAQTLENLFNRLEESRSETTTAVPEPKKPEGIGSSNVHSFGYDDKTGKLLVKFQGDYPQENGPVYGYEGVPKNIFELFKQGAIPARTDGKNKWGQWWKGKVPSLGASLYTLIKNGGYPYQKLS